MHTPDCNKVYKLKRTVEFAKKQVGGITPPEAPRPVRMKERKATQVEERAQIIKDENAAVTSLEEDIRVGRVLAGIDTSLVPTRIVDEKGVFDFAGSDVTSMLNYLEGTGRHQFVMNAIEDQAVMARGRKTITNEETKALAEEIGFGDLLGKSPLDPEKLAANVYAVFDKLKAVGKLMEQKAEAMASPNATAEDAVALARLAYQYQRMGMSAMGIRASLGRGLQILNKVAEANAGPEKLAALDAALKAYQVEGGSIDQLAATIRLSGNNSKAIGLASRGIMARGMDAVTEYWMNSLLSGPATGIANLMSNTAVTLMHPLEQAVAAVVGKGPDKVYMGEVGQTLQGLVENASFAARAAYQAFKNEMPTFEGTPEYATAKAIPGVWGRIIRTPSNLLMAGDEFFKRINHHGALRSLLYRHARAKLGMSHADAVDFVNLKVNTIGEEIPDEIRKAARQQALYQTFTNDLDRPDALSALGRLSVRFRSEFPMAAFIIPFVRTPLNIVKYAQDRSLFALLDKDIRADLMAGGPRKDQAVARMMFGTGIGLTAFSLAAQGYLTGSGPSDPDERRVWEAAGNRPYSMRVGDTMIQYSRYAPWGIVLGVAADMAELIPTLQSDDPKWDKAKEVFFKMIGTVAKNIGDQTMIAGLVNFQRAFTEPDKYVDNLVYSLAGGFVPGALAAGARVMDPGLRELEDMNAALLQRVPGARKGITPKLGLFGEEIKAFTTGTPAEQLQAGLLPGYKGEVKKDPVYQMLVDIKYAPAAPSKNVTIRGKDYELNKAQVNEISLIAGPRLRKALDRLIASSRFQSLDSERKRDLVERLVRQFRTGARQQYVANLIRSGKVSELTPARK